MGKRTGMVLGLTVMLAGCASTAEQEQLERDRQSITSSLETLRQRSTVTCSDSVQCQTYWLRARTYAEQHSATRVQVESDRMLSTYNPVDYGTAALMVRRVPVASVASRETIQIDGVCKGMYGMRSTGSVVTGPSSRIEAGPKLGECAMLLMQLFQGFGPFVTGKSAS